MAEVRAAAAGDLPQLVRMARSFHAQTALAFVEFDEHCFSDLCLRLMGSEDALLLVADGGMLAMLVYPHYFNANKKGAQELFWWVDPDKRGKGLAGALLDAGQTWAKARGAITVQMIALDELDGELVGQMYRRRGYVPLERSYVRRL